MAELKQWAAVDAGTVVHGGFDAPQELIDGFVERIVDNPAVTTPPWWHEGVTFVDVTGLDPRPVEGFTKAGNGRWVAPPPPPGPSPEEQAALDQRVADDAFIAAMEAKVRDDVELAQDERDRLMVLQLARTVTPPPNGATAP